MTSTITMSVWLFSVVGLIMIFLSFSANNWLQSLLLNLGTSFVGSAIVIRMTDYVILTHQEEEKKRIQSTALTQFHSHIIQYIESFFIPYKAVVERKHSIKGFDSLFCDNYYNVISKLNLSLFTIDENKFPESIPWYTWIIRNYDAFDLNVNKMLNRYISYLDSDIILLLEEITKTQYISFMRHQWKELQPIEREDIDLKLWGAPAIQNDLRTHLFLLRKLLVCYNQKVPAQYQVTIDDALWNSGSLITVSIYLDDVDRKEPKPVWSEQIDYKTSNGFIKATINYLNSSGAPTEKEHATFVTVTDIDGKILNGGPVSRAPLTNSCKSSAK